MAATFVITDLGNDIQVAITGSVHSVTTKYTFNKLTMRVKQSQHFVIITNSESFNQGKENKVLEMDYTKVTTPTYASNDDLYNGLLGMISGVSVGASGGGGGGDNSYSNVNNEDFTATPTVGTTNITIAGLGAFTLERANISSIEKFSSAGVKETLNVSAATVSGGVITLTNEDDFVSGDTVRVFLTGPKKAYDEGVDSDVVTVINPDSEKWTSVEHLVDFADDATTVYYVIPMEGFKDLSKHWKFTGGGVVTMTLWGTNNPAADDTAVTDWVDITGDFLSKTLTVSAGTIEFAEVLENLFFLKVMVRLVTTGTTNIADIYIKKKAI